MYAEINSAVQAAKVLYDVVKANKDLTNFNELSAAVSEVYTKVMNATAVALASQEKQTLLTDRIRELEKKIMEFENWKSEIQKYKLYTFPIGTHAFILKPEMQEIEPLHYLCEACANNHQISRMQPTGFHYEEAFFLRCHKCKLLIPIKSMSPVLEAGLKSSMSL